MDAEQARALLATPLPTSVLRASQQQGGGETRSCRSFTRVTLFVGIVVVGSLGYCAVASSYLSGLALTLPPLPIATLVEKDLSALQPSQLLVQEAITTVTGDNPSSPPSSSSVAWPEPLKRLQQHAVTGVKHHHHHHEHHYYSPPRAVTSSSPPPRALDIVIACHNPTYIQELAQLLDVPAVVDRKPHWIIYTKTDEPLPDLSSEMFGFDEVIRLPNVGRESHSYLYHMVHRRHDLAQHTIFCQEEPHSWENLVTRLTNLFTDHTGFMSLTYEGLCYCEGCGWDNDLPLLSGMYSIFRHDLCHTPFTASFEGCFLVSRKRMEAVPLDDLHYALDLLEAPEGHWAHDPDLYPTDLDHSSSPANPHFGHVMERMWSVVFNCSDPGVMDQDQDCDDLRRCLGPQCLDEEI